MGFSSGLGLPGKAATYGRAGQQVHPQGKSRSANPSQQMVARKPRSYRAFRASGWLWGAFWPMVNTVQGHPAFYPCVFRTLLMRPGENNPARAA